MPATDAGGDTRVLPVLYDGGERICSWESVCRGMHQVDPTAEGWAGHMSGPPSAVEALQKYRAAGGPMGHHREW
eukprot:4366440-Alexandrium_andersonii.AAC.1